MGPDGTNITIIPAAGWEAYWERDEDDQEKSNAHWNSEPVIAWTLYWRSDPEGRCKVVRWEPVILSGRAVEAVGFTSSETPLSEYIFLDQPTKIVNMFDSESVFNERRDRKQQSK